MNFSVPYKPLVASFLGESCMDAVPLKRYPIMLIYIRPYYHEVFHFLFRLFAVLMSFIAVLKDLSVLLKRLVSILITLLFHSQLLIDSLVKKISSQGTNVCAFKFTMYFLDIRINQSFKILDILGS